MWVLAYVANALWQAPLVALAGWLSARWLRWAGPRVVHRVWVVALAAQVLLPASAFPVLPGVRAAFALLWHGSGSAGSVIAVSTTAHALQNGVWNLFAMRACLEGYAVVLAFLLLRFFRRIARVHALRRTVFPLQLDAAEAGQWRACTAAFQLPPVSLGESDAITTPMTVGWWPAILVLPRGMAGASDPGQMFAALAHEAAHIHRHDYGKNLLYEVAMLPLAWHPALWFVRERLTESREMVCDAMAADVAGGHVRYAESLLRLALLLIDGRPAGVSHAIGIFDAHTLERRIEMLTAEQGNIGRARRLAAVALCVGIGIVTCGSALALRVEPQTGSPSETGTQKNSSGPIRVAGAVAAGQIVTKVVPKYPQEAKDAKVQGAVVMKAIIDEKGGVQDLTVLSGPKELRQSALDAVKQWVYKPYLLNGDPVAVDTTVTVTYSLAP